MLVAIIGSILYVIINEHYKVFGAGPITCNENPTFNYHIHTHLNIFVAGHAVTVPAKIGFINGILICSLHTHDTSGYIHIESLVNAKYTLAQFLDLWNITQPATYKHVFGSNSYPTTQFKPIILKDQEFLTINKQK